MAPTVTHRRATTSLDLLHRGPSHDPVIVVVKRHGNRANFEHEVRWLATARHLPVARIEAIVAEELTIVTRFNPALTLADTATEPATALSVVTELARVVGELTIGGLTHGHLDSDHVLRDRRGRIFIVSPAPTDTPDADLVGLARCCRQVLETADAIAVERGRHPWTDRDRQRWQELTTVLTTGGLGPHRAARHMEALGREMGEPDNRRLRRWLRS